MLHYLYIYFVSHKNFQRLVLVSVFPTTYLFIETDTKMTHERRILAQKSCFSLFLLPPQKKNYEIKRVLNDFVVTYQKQFPPNKNLAIIW